MISVSQAIGDKRPHMSKSHRLLADYVGEKGDKAAFMTSFQLASVTGLSQSTVVRFAAVLGYGGYRAFQEALRAGLKYRLDAGERYAALQETASDSALLAALAATDALNIKATLSRNSPQKLAALAESLGQASQVYMYAQGLAAPSALYLAAYLGLLRPGVICVNLTGMDAFASLAGVGEGDLLLVVSFPLHTPATLALMDMARGRGAGVAAISEAEDSEAGIRADISLAGEWGELGVNGSMAPVIALCNALICLTARHARAPAPGITGLGQALSHTPQEAP